MLSSDLVATLRAVSTGTITTILLKKGLRRTWMHGPKPIREGYPRLVGPAFTMRFVPARAIAAITAMGLFNHQIKQRRPA